MLGRSNAKEVVEDVISKIIFSVDRGVQIEMPFEVFNKELISKFALQLLIKN